MNEVWSPLEEYPWEVLNRDIVAPLVKKQLDCVYEKSPFYQKKFGAGIRGSSFTLPGMRELPFTEKQELLDDERERPPFGSYAIVPSVRIARVHRTSGTNAQPLMLAFSRADIENSIECGARCFWSAGVRPGDMVAHCLNYCMWTGGITDHQSLERTGAAVMPFGVGNSSDLVRTMLTLKPSGIHCTPSYLSKLEAVVSQEFSMAPSGLGLKLGLFGGEGGVQNRDFRRRIEALWAFRAMDANYGVSDVLSMCGAECKVRDGLHFMGQGVVYPELKSLENNDIVQWEKGVRGELILTNVLKECQPLVRYRTHDIVEVVGVDSCGCGRRSPRFRVVGRVEDMVVVRGVNIFTSSVAAVVNKRLDVLTGEFRILVDAHDPIERFVIRIEVKKDVAQEGLCVQLTDLFKASLYVRPVVEMVPEGSLPRTAGKTRYLERIL